MAPFEFTEAWKIFVVILPFIEGRTDNDVSEKHIPAVRRVLRTEDCRLPSEQIDPSRASRTIGGWIRPEDLRYLLDSLERHWFELPDGATQINELRTRALANFQKFAHKSN